MRKIAIIHFQPVELYPPAQNLIRFMEKEAVNSMIYFFTTVSPLKQVQQFKAISSNIKMLRSGKFSNKSSIVRYGNYLFFYLSCLFYLIKKKPEKVLYIETLSFLPVYLYKRFFNSAVELLVHYHEYISNSEYKTTMLLSRYFHSLEKQYYPQVRWLSHTNEYRMDMFLAENTNVPLTVTHILPNYPPKSWFQPTKLCISKPVKFVCAGALGLDTMYLKEFVTWINDQQGKAVLDLYSLNIGAEAKLFLEENKSLYVGLPGAVNYEQLAAILPKYDVGVILYKGVIPNHTFSASNKLFEYLACGLDVWFPEEITGSLKYVTNGTYPKIVAVDFKALEHIDLNVMINRCGLRLSNKTYYSEDVLPSILLALS